LGVWRWNAKYLYDDILGAFFFERTVKLKLNISSRAREGAREHTLITGLVAPRLATPEASHGPEVRCSSDDLSG
jgi:hypothetical protein